MEAKPTPLPATQTQTVLDAGAQIRKRTQQIKDWFLNLLQRILQRSQFPRKWCVYNK